MIQVNSSRQIIKSKRELFQVRTLLENKKKKRSEIIIMLTGAELLARKSEIFVYRILLEGFFMHYSRAIESCCHAFILDELRFFFLDISILLFIFRSFCVKNILPHVRLVTTVFVNGYRIIVRLF